MARRRMTVDDDVEILVHLRAGRGIRQIARSLGRSRNTVKDRTRYVQVNIRVVR